MLFSSALPGTNIDRVQCASSMWPAPHSKVHHPCTWDDCPNPTHALFQRKYFPTNPRDPSTFSEGDWRHCYVGLEGPVVPSEKVLGSRLKYPEGSAHIRTLHGGRGRSLDRSQGWVGGRGAEPKSRAFLRVRILRVQYGSESKFMVES